MIRIEEYLTSENKSPFGEWFLGLGPQAAAIVTVALGRLGDGNAGNTKPIGEGAAELKINRGPGYRVYFGWDGDVLVILLGGGTKRRQQSDIQKALKHWRAYKARKASSRRQ